MGDIGDYVKLALLRNLARGRRLGIAWYLFPDEGHNDDGKHISYLSNPQKWRHLDPELFDRLGDVVAQDRSLRSLEQSGILEKTTFSRQEVYSERPPKERVDWRSKWFQGVLDELHGCDLVFADPDNGIVDNCAKRARHKKFGKQIPLSEILSLAEGRTAMIYHHNTRRKGGHDLEVDHWLNEIDAPALAIRANAFSCRTFFVINPDSEVADRARNFADNWARHGVWIHGK
ncbi:MAG: hypothetical protein JXR14_09600 [Paracoccaceae bacterium]